MAFTQADLGLIGSFSTNKQFMYISNDTLAVIKAASYFNDAYNELSAGDAIMVVSDKDGGDGINLLVVTASSSSAVTVFDSETGVQELTVSGAVTPGIRSIELNHASVIVAATIANAALHQGFLMVKDTSATGTAAHTVTLTGGTWDGTNTVVTLNALNEAILVFIDSAGNGTIIENVGTVVLS